MGTTEKLTSCWERVVSCCCCCCNASKQDRRLDPKDVRIIANPAVADKGEFEGYPDANRPLPSPPGFIKPVGERYIALFDYSARTVDDLNFKTGDILEVLDSNAGEWWLARAITGISANNRGYIPANYVAIVESLYAEPWYFPDMKRMDAEKVLLAEGNRQGSFLVRNSESLKGELSLSVLHQGKELVEYYSRQADGLCVSLGEPCRKIEAPQTYGLSYNTVDQWEIPRNSIKLLTMLGAGQFGEVYEGVWNETTSVAVKTLKPGTMDRTEFLREAQLMKRLRHPKLIQLYAVCTLEDPIYIITELMKNGSLLGYLRKDNGATLHIKDQIEMAAQVASGMAYLEQQNYIHRDLAARNVLVGENNICKVADFGLARVFMKENENVYEAKEGGKFPVKWTAPEGIYDNKFTIKSDVWSFGILLYEIITFGKMPYPTMTNMETVQWLARGKRMDCPAGCPKALYPIMLNCWKDNERDRPTFETLQWQLEEFFDMDLSSYDDSAHY
ncbi:hypothetical protein CRENBAI_014807 [Crenichthys baileyi]|uniref:Tyrosine-protein kinase n=1 Tax=Crenichthys baileyi TaxID=28760 RepID=A0AAV9QVR3_9TELE